MKYIAITIGPIYNTFKNVRKTRELWAASYIFSYISKGLLEKILEKDEKAILSPHYNKENPIGIGLYPDRIFLKSNNQINISAIEEFKVEIFKEIAFWMNEPSALTFLSNYFRIYIVEYMLGESENPLIAGNNFLDTAELRSNWELEESANLLLKFLRSVNTLKTNNRKWILDHLREKDIYGEVRFESMPEIGSRPLREINPNLYKGLVNQYCYQDKDIDDGEEGFIKDLQKGLNLKDKPDIFKNYHKYVCIVKADGDKVGKYISAIRTDCENGIHELSTALYNWGVDSSALIKAYSGIPIYIGGDDVLFLAPVVGVNKKSILDLTYEINNSFVKHFATLPTRVDDKGDLIRPTLSFGVSITYYKFPLFEALDKADFLLHQAKETRNNCSISLLKHSGSHFNLSLPNESNAGIRKSFNETEKYFTEDKSFISSIIHHFRQNEEVYRIVGNDPLKVLNFLKNNFDTDKHKKFVECLANLCFNVYLKNNGTAGQAESEKSIEEIYSLLRILKFLKGQEDGK